MSNAIRTRAINLFDQKLKQIPRSPAPGQEMEPERRVSTIMETGNVLILLFIVATIVAIAVQRLTVPYTVA